MYHNVPEPMVGTTLIPLNAMPAKMGEIKQKNLTKYVGREEILERRVPLLDCAWNDVLRFLPLHPRQVFELQVELGIIPEVPHYTFFQIDPALLEADKAAVFFKTKPGEENVTVQWLKDVDFASLQTIPEATVNYYRSVVGTGELPFNYQFIPHILYKGTLDVSDVTIITL